MSSASPNSTRISKRFAELRASGELGIVAYITAGDPSLDATLKFVLALAEAGADVIELGVPFSDPLADGLTIQRASERALKSGTTLAGVLDLVRRIRQSSPPANDVPLVLFSYYNPILQMGVEKFASSAAAAGADGVLATDLTPEESGENRRLLLRLPLSHLPHRCHRRERCSPRRSARAFAPGPQRHATPYCRRLRYLAPRPCFRSRRPRRRRRHRLGPRVRN